MAVFGIALPLVSKLVTPLWVEALFVLFFILGFTAIRRRRKGKYVAEDIRPKEKVPPLLQKRLEAHIQAGRSEAALMTWHMVKNEAPIPLETLKRLVAIILNVSPDLMVQEIVDHFSAHRRTHCNANNAIAVLDVVARAGRADLLDSLARDFRQMLFIQPTVLTYEVLLGGHAHAGDENRVSELFHEIGVNHKKVTARGYCLTIKGFLKNRLVDAAWHRIQDMQQQGFAVPPFALVQLFQVACQVDRTQEFFEATSQIVQLPEEAFPVLLEDCLRRTDLPLALRIKQFANDNKTPLSASAYDALLKLCVLLVDDHAFQFWDDLQQDGFCVNEGLCVGLLSRCADSKFLRFAEVIAQFFRDRDGKSIAGYSALMKVYAYCGMYDKACDLLSEIRSRGLEPDNVMYGCLIKFSAECGRTDLSRELFEKVPVHDIQNFMSLIRAASKEKDVGRAFSVLEDLKTFTHSVDIAAYNAVLDACASTGDTKRARALMSEMQNLFKLDIVTYNTLLKGYCSSGDLHGAQEVLAEMKQMGLEANDVSYNILLNGAVASGNFKEAWRTIGTMERNGVPVDHYSISIIMKSLKRVRDPRDVDRALGLLDRSGVDICSDAVLFSAVLDACTRHRQLHRLESVVDQFGRSNLRPTIHIYGSLIKACGILKWVDKCRELWSKMVDEHTLQPDSIVMGCMLDALACNEKADEAFDLMKAWKSTIPPNVVMYSIIIKGFASSYLPSRALDMWSEMREMGLSMNALAYNALIDSQARIGAMDKVSDLVASMGPNGCTPDDITYSTILKGYCVKGDLDKAFEVFRDMQSSGMAAQANIYNTLLDASTRQNRTDIVDSVLDDMAKYKVKPSNCTIGVLIKMYGRRGQLDKAFQVMEELPRTHRLRVNAQMRASLVSACLANQEPDRAMKVFEELKEAEGGADAKLYGNLLSGLVRLGHVEKAALLVEDAHGLSRDGSGHASRRGLHAGQVLDSDILEQLMRALCQRGLARSIGFPLIERLRAAGVTSGCSLLSALQTGRSH